MTKPLHPRPLCPGDSIALVSPSGPVAGPEVVDQCKAALEGFGYKVHVGMSAAKRIDYLAGSDRERVADLNAALRDPAIRGVFCTRGGYGSNRLLPMIDYDALRHDPKIFAGFSDLSAVHAAIAARANVATLHSTTLAAALVTESSKLIEPAKAAFLHQIQQATPLGSLRAAAKWNDFRPMRPGKARGRLMGGNLSVFATLCGSPYLPNVDGAILVLEDVGEEPYKLDRFFTQLALAGVFDRIAGLVLGQFTDSDPTADGRLKWDEAAPRILDFVRCPILANAPIGHVPFNMALPFGCEAELDATGGDLVLTESLCVAS